MKFYFFLLLAYCITIGLKVQQDDAFKEGKVGPMNPLPYPLDWPQE